jgi:hypothetical protein
VTIAEDLERLRAQLAAPAPADARERILALAGELREAALERDCPARLALCGVPCGCRGRNPSHAAIAGARRLAALEDERCDHVAFVGYPARCELPATHAGDHGGGAGTRHGWTHGAGLPSYVATGRNHL